MGCSQSVLPERMLKTYQDLTYLSKKEILDVYKRYEGIVRLNSQELMTPDVVDSLAIKLDDMEHITELAQNPFNKRICEVFADQPSRGMTFEDFLEMMSVFSDKAPKELKVEYAFRIYDMDGDDFIGREDLLQVIQCLIGDNELTTEYTDKLVENIIKESDLDDDEKLSFAEFEHVISKSPDFMNTFRMRI